MFRLPEERGLINRLGFNSDGADAVAERLKRWERSGRAHRIPLGINIGKTKVAEDAAADYVATFSRIASFGDYITVNVELTEHAGPAGTSRSETPSRRSSCASPPRDRANWPREALSS